MSSPAGSDGEWEVLRARRAGGLSGGSSATSSSSGSSTTSPIWVEHTASEDLEAVRAKLEAHLRALQEGRAADPPAADGAEAEAGAEDEAEGEDEAGAGAAPAPSPACTVVPVSPAGVVVSLPVSPARPPTSSPLPRSAPGTPRRRRRVAPAQGGAEPTLVVVQLSPVSPAPAVPAPAPAPAPAVCLEYPSAPAAGAAGGAPGKKRPWFVRAWSRATRCLQGLFGCRQPHPFSEFADEEGRIHSVGV